MSESKPAPKKSLKEKVNRGLAFVGIAAVSSGVMAEGALAAKSAKGGKVEAKAPLINNANQRSEAGNPPVNKDFLKMNIDMDKLNVEFLEQMRESDKPQMLYGALVIKAKLGKNIEAHQAPVPDVFEKWNLSPTDDLNDKYAPHDVAIIASPVYVKFHGEWYVWGYAYGNGDSAPNQPADTSLMKKALAHNLAESSLSQHEETQLNTQVHNTMIFKLSTLQQNADLEYWSYQNVKPTWVKTQAAGGNIYMRSDPKLPQTALPGAYITDKTPTSLTGQIYSDFLRGHSYTHRMPANFNPGLPY